MAVNVAGKSDVDHLISKTGGSCPPFLVKKPGLRDLESLKRQMAARKFDAGIALEVVHRCRWGFPQVILCRPLFKGRPFPTTFWLSCPHLDQICGQSEAYGGVKSLEDSLEGRFDTWVKYHLRHVSLRMELVGASRSQFLARYQRGILRALQTGGVGGIRLRDRITVKCLHLQTASWLALGRHPGSRWLTRSITPLECSCPDDFPCGGLK